MENQSTPQEATKDPNEELLMGFHQLIARCANESDFFLSISAKSQEIKDALEGQILKYGPEAETIFPPQGITIKEDQELPVFFVRMSDMQGMMIQEMHPRFLNWLSNSMAQRVGLKTIDVQGGPEGKTIKYLPFCYTDQDVKVAMLSAFYTLYFMETGKSKLIIPGG